MLSLGVTANHHDGLCLWDTTTTDLCAAAAMRFWDRLRDGSELLAWYDATHPGARDHLARRRTWARS